MVGSVEGLVFGLPSIGITVIGAGISVLLLGSAEDEVVVGSLREETFETSVES